MTERDLLLAIDNGTQSVRALVFDAQGNLLLKARVPIEPYVSPQPGWAENDPDYYWRALCEACQMLWRQAEATGSPAHLRERIAAVALTTQRSTLINVGRDGKPLRPAIVWLDQRRTYGLKPVGGLWGAAFAVSGMRETVAYLQAEAEANWIRTNQPEIWEQTHKYLLLSGYLTYLLTGRFVDSVAAQVAYTPFDYKKLQWASPSDWKWQAVPMPRDFLVDLVPPAGLLGEISPAAAEATGIRAGTPLIAAAADKACEVIGAGCVDPHVACLSYGTTATINTTHKRYIEVIPLIPPYPAAVPGAYSLEIQVYRGFWMVSWFKDNFAHRERVAAEELGIEPEALFDELIAQTPPGSLGLMLQPYWSPGLKRPGPEAKGAIVGFGDVHNRAHVYRAILEGIGYALLEGRDRTEQRTGVKIAELRVAGGGSQSDAAMQLAADMFNLPTARPHIYETSGLGAAIDAAVGAGMHRDFDVAVRAMTRISRVFEPNPVNFELYNSLYQRVYRRLYARLQPLYEEIRDITGYPRKA